MSGDCAVCRFRFDSLAVGRHEDRGHQAERTESLCHAVGLHVAIIVLARPDVSAVPFQRASDHIVDETVLVCQACRLELILEFGFENLGEDVFEFTIIRFEDGVFG